MPHTTAGGRHFARIVPDGELFITDSSLGSVVEVLDVSLGGFRGAGRLPLAPGARHLFEAKFSRIPPIVLEARVIHCYRSPDDPTMYVTGWIWIDMPVNAAAVRRFIGAITSLDDLEETLDAGDRLTAR